MNNVKQIIWVIAKWSSIAAVLAVAYSFYNEQDTVTRGFVALSVLILYLAFLIVKRIDGTNIFASTGTKSLKRSYVCVFRKEIYGVDDDVMPVVTLRQKPKDVILPFPPYVGLSVSDGILHRENREDKEYTEFYSGKIEKIYWNNAANIFTCEVASLKIERLDILGGVIDNYERHDGWIIDGHNPEAEKALEEWRTQRAAE